MLEDVRKLRLLLPSLALLPAFVGCNSSSPVVAGSRPRAQQEQIEQARQEMELVPPPSKTRYMAVKSLTAWENPFLTVQGGMVTLHVLVADANTSGLGEGGLLRPVAARKQDLNIRLSDLATALNAIPRNAWPYGRVVAVEEAHNIPEKARPEVRRNLESTVQTLNDLGIVVYEWPEGGPGLR